MSEGKAKARGGFGGTLQPQSRAKTENNKTALIEYKTAPTMHISRHVTGLLSNFMFTNVRRTETISFCMELLSYKSIHIELRDS